jgi:hypothetical protein
MLRVPERLQPRQAAALDLTLLLGVEPHRDIDPEMLTELPGDLAAAAGRLMRSEGLSRLSEP